MQNLLLGNGWFTFSKINLEMDIFLLSTLIMIRLETFQPSEVTTGEELIAMS